MLVVDEGGNEPEEEMTGGANDDGQYEDIDPKDISRSKVYPKDISR